MEEFHYVILGDEPAGLWLARRIWEEAMKPPMGVSNSHQNPSAPSEPREARQVPAPKIAVIHWTDLARPTLFPAPLAKRFQLPSPSATWSAEILTPSRALTWNASHLNRLFPDLAPIWEGLQDLFTNEGTGTPLGVAALRPTPAQSQVLRHAIKRSPELATYASGIWKAVGRSRALAPESILWGSLFATELCDWDPYLELPKEISRISLMAKNNVLQSAKKLPTGQVLLEFEGQPAIATDQLFLNVSLRRLALLSGGTPDLWDVLPVDDSLLTFEATYPLQLRVENSGLPCPLQPLTILFDTDEIPDLEREVWSLRYQALSDAKQLTLWAEAPREISLDAVLESFREGMAKLNRLFPYLSRSLQQISPALSMETCFEDSQRIETLTTLDSLAIESYRSSALRTDTRWSGVLSLSPFLHCHLPYPLGPLLEAQRELQQIQRRYEKLRKPAPKWFSKTSSPRSEEQTP